MLLRMSLTLRCWDVTVLGRHGAGTGLAGRRFWQRRSAFAPSAPKHLLIVNAKYGALFSAARRPESRSPWLYGVSGILPAAQLSKLLPDPVACLLLLL